MNQNNNFRGNENRNNYQQNNAVATAPVEMEAPKVGVGQKVVNAAKWTQSTKTGRYIGAGLALAGVVDLGIRAYPHVKKGVIWAYQNTLGRVFGKNKKNPVEKPAEQPAQEAPEK